MPEMVCIHVHPRTLCGPAVVKSAISALAGLNVTLILRSQIIVTIAATINRLSPV